MNVMERWVARNPYLCGEEISFADLLGAHEFMSHHAGQIIAEETWSKYPHLRRWFDEILARPHTQAVSEMIMAVGAMRLAGQIIPMTRATSLAKGTAVEPGVPVKTQ